MTRILLPAVAILLAITSCSKKDDDTPPPAGGGGGNQVALFAPKLQYLRNGQQHVHEGPAWIFASASTVQEFNGPQYHHALQEAVISLGTAQTEQWRIGFIGTFVTPSGTPPSPQQMGGMASPSNFFYGRFLWDEDEDSYMVTEGVRVTWIDPDGVEWSSDRVPGTNPGSFAVSVAQSTGLASGTVRQVKLTFSCQLRNDDGGSIGITNGAYQGPLVVL